MSSNSFDFDDDDDSKPQVQNKSGLNTQNKAGTVHNKAELGKDLWDFSYEGSKAKPINLTQKNKADDDDEKKPGGKLVISKGTAKPKNEEMATKNAPTYKTNSRNKQMNAAKGTGQGKPGEGFDPTLHKKPHEKKGGITGVKLEKGNEKIKNVESSSEEESEEKPQPKKIAAPKKVDLSKSKGNKQLSSSGESEDEPPPKKKAPPPKPVAKAKKKESSSEEESEEDKKPKKPDPKLKSPTRGSLAKTNINRSPDQKVAKKLSSSEESDEETIPSPPPKKKEVPVAKPKRKISSGSEESEDENEKKKKEKPMAKEKPKSPAKKASPNKERAKNESSSDYESSGEEKKEEEKTENMENRKKQQEALEEEDEDEEDDYDENMDAEAMKDEDQPPTLEVDIANQEDLDLSNLPAFAHMQPPKGKVIQCNINRDKSSIGKKLMPLYHVTQSSTGTYLISGKKKGMGTKAHYQLFSSMNDLNKKSESYVGKLRSNFQGTEFHAYDRGKNPKKEKNEEKRRREVACVKYEKNYFGWKGPRKMEIYIPGIEDENKVFTIKPKNKKDNMKERYKAGVRDQVQKLINKPPKWSEEYQAFVLNFYGRVRLASVKNFQLICEENEDYILLQFGKVSEHVFTMDFQWPMTIAQAFMICLSSFDFKIACE